jgi:pimeloyl-ACP methyl ester carboxylesterase
MSHLAHFTIGGRNIAYRLREGASPTIVFLPGYASDMEGVKASALDSLAERLGVSMLRFDYSGTGSSAGRFDEGTLSLWLEEGLEAVDRLTEGPLILVGSSMGAWIGLHLALLRSQRVRAMVGIASAPDFTDWAITEEKRSILLRDGRLEEPNPYGDEPAIFTRDFVESGQRLLLLTGEIAVDCPCRLLHGDNDREVPLEIAFRLMRALRSSDVQLKVLKGGAHRLSEPNEIQALVETLEALLEPTD